MTTSFKIGGVAIAPGERKKITLSIARLYDFTEMKIPVEVIRGKKPGPVLFVCAALHGDEINGVDIIRQLLHHPRIRNINGTLIAVPIVNVFGFNDKSRYLPDRRDLNRCFPGSDDGSLGSQLAHIFMTEIVEKSTHGIDLHTGAFHRTNLPQIRANLDDPETKRLATAFGVPVIINASTRDGSLRECVAEKMPMILYEGGAALRFDDNVIKTGIKGIISFMRAIDMLPALKKPAKPSPEPFLALSSHWIRAPHSGILLTKRELGEYVHKGDILGYITNPFGDHRTAVESQRSGIIIGMTCLPLANEGDALFHVATSRKVETSFDSIASQESVDPVNMTVEKQ